MLCKMRLVQPTCHMPRVGQNRIYTPYMTVRMVMFLLKILHVHRIYLYMYGSGQPYTCHTAVLASAGEISWTQRFARELGVCECSMVSNKAAVFLPCFLYLCRE